MKLDELKLGDTFDPNSVDYFICYPCSKVGHDEENKIVVAQQTVHAYAGTPPEHYPPYNRNVTYGMQELIWTYEMTIDTESGARIAEFVNRARMEDQMGIRDPDIIPINTKYVIPEVSALTRRSDMTDRPLLPGEIEEWLLDLRKRNNFPEHLLDVPFYKQATLAHSMLQVEVFRFCLWLNDQTVGAGSQMFSGRLNAGLLRIGATEQDLQDEGWGGPIK